MESSPVCGVGDGVFEASPRDPPLTPTFWNQSLTSSTAAIVPGAIPSSRPGTRTKGGYQGPKKPNHMRGGMRSREKGSSSMYIYVVYLLSFLFGGGGLHKTHPKMGGVDFHPLPQRF